MARQFDVELVVKHTEIGTLPEVAHGRFIPDAEIGDRNGNGPALGGRSRLSMEMRMSSVTDGP